MSNSIVFPMGRRGITGATGAQGAGVATLEPRIDDIENPAISDRFICIDPLNGNDANAGTSLAPIKTFAQIESLIRGSIGRVNIYINANIEADYSIRLTNPPKTILIYGRTADWSANAFRTITVVNATNSTTRPGGFRFQSQCDFYSYNINYHFNTSRNFGFVELFCTQIASYVRYCTCSRDAGSTGVACLFYGSSGGGAMVTFVNFTLGTLTGYLFSGVAAGVNPNNVWPWRTNLTSG